jgi:hypothetical protein
MNTEVIEKKRVASGVVFLIVFFQILITITIFLWAFVNGFAGHSPAKSTIIITGLTSHILLLAIAFLASFKRRDGVIAFLVCTLVPAILLYIFLSE